ASATDATSSPANVNDGLAVGNPLTRLLEKVAVPQDFSGKPDVTYAPQAASITQATGYYLYYNNAAETGSRTSVPASKLRQYPFNNPSDIPFDQVDDAEVASGSSFADIETTLTSTFGMHEESAMVLV